MEIVGRDELLDGWVVSRNPIEMLVGDSGTGKSTVLREAQLRLRASGDVAPDPVATQRSPGSLQRALLESLSAALADIANDEGSLERIARVLLDAGSKVLDKRLADLRAGLGRALMGWVRNKVGDHVGDVLEDFGTALSQSEDESLRNRLSAAGENDIVEQLASFASDVAQLADGRMVHLALDDVDRLDDSDLRRLADLVESLPSTVQVRLTFTVWDSVQRDRADELVLGHVARTELGGLSAKSVAEWLKREGLPINAAHAVMTATNGYPLHVGDAVELMKGPDGVDALRGFGPNDVVETRTLRAWNGLDQHTQLQALKLAAYSSPLSAERACAVLGVDLATWSVVSHRLVQAAFMIDGEVRWFHNLRRQALWRRVAPVEMADLAYEAATIELLELLASPSPPPEAYIDFALVAGRSPAVLQRNKSIGEVLDATRDEVAVMASIIEIAEHNGPVAMAAGVASHAVSAFGLTGDPVEVLESLENRELLKVVSDEHRSAVVGRFNCQEAVDVTIGRAARELGRLPTPQLASSIMSQAVFPLVDGFNAALYGIGDPTASSMAEKARELITQPAPDRITYLESGSAVMLRARVGGLPFYSTISFEDPDAAARSLSALTGAPLEVQGRSLDLDLALAVPEEPVASARFALAVARLYDARSMSVQPKSLDEAMDPIEHLRTKLAIYEIIAQLCTERERHAYDLSRQRGAAYLLSDETLLTYEIRGRGGLHPLAESLAADGFEQYARLRVEQALGLGAGASVGEIVSQFRGLGEKDPLTEVVLSLSKSAKQFNRAQTQRRLLMTRESLQAALSAAAEQAFLDATALSAKAPKQLVTELTPMDEYFLIEEEVPQGGWTPGARCSYISITVPGGSDCDRAFVEMVPAGDDGEQRLTSDERIERIEDAFGLEAGNAHTLTQASVLHALPERLGHGDGELRFDYPASLQS